MMPAAALFPVVPAKAGTHTPRRLFWKMLFDGFRATTRACGYGSLLSQGRREWGNLQVVPAFAGTTAKE